MPRKQRQLKRRIDLLTDDQKEMLLTGHDWFRTFRSPEEIERVWFENRDHLLQYWLQDPETWKKKGKDPLGEPEPGGPGTRPWAWWKFEAPEEPRRRTGGKGNAVRDRPDCPEWARGLSFGKPHVF